ncbi:hypothetical protein D3C75_809360 [compost metagenome]
MANTIGTAGSDINIRLSQSPDIKDPKLNYEFQTIYNSLHLLSQYLNTLKDNLESAPGQNPAESVRFRRRFWAVALQNIAVGAVCSASGDGVVNGIATNLPATGVVDPAVTVGSTGSRRRFGMVPNQFFIALTEATAGQLVQLGVGPGILELAGAKCGQTVWGVGAVSVKSYRDANTVPQYTIAGDLVGNGGLYLQNIVGRFNVPAVWYQWEGYWLPGFPTNNGGTYFYNRAFLYPIGICVLDGFVLFADYKRSDPLKDQSF